MLELYVNHQHLQIRDESPSTTLLDYLRNHLQLKGTKEGCASGDCGACTVVVGRRRCDPDPETTQANAEDSRSTLEYSTANSCITPLAALHGTQVLTIDSVGTPDSLHPVQSAMVDHHASQCGFCTPGFVMSLVGAELENTGLQTTQVRTSHDIAPLIAGNLCRCTGYRSILAAARTARTLPAGDIPALADAELRLRAIDQKPSSSERLTGYHSPTTEADLRELLQAASHEPRLVAGGTDLWLEVTQRYQALAPIIDLSQVIELAVVTIGPDVIHIGASVTHARLLTLFGPAGPLACEPVASMLERFASPQIRNRGTIGGNLANGSPIADWPPVLLVLDAEVELVQADGTQRWLPLTEFWRGYRSTALTPGGYLRGIRFPAPAWPTLEVFKISKRFEDDISTVLGAFRLEVVDEHISTARVAYGGVAATPIRLQPVEQLLIGHTPEQCLLSAGLRKEISELLSDLVTPISDVRGSAGYRSAMVEALLRRALHATASDSRPSGLATVKATRPS
ncbi:MAG: xanthine dehydrogenase small subunit [Pseudomonadales bacterium]